MLICNNCGELNPGHALKCQKCQMPNRLSPCTQTGEDAEVEVQLPTIGCLNCGTHTSLTEDKCQHCSFPLPNNVLGAQKKQELQFVKPIRKTA